MEQGLERKAVSVKEGREITGLGKNSFYELLQSGKIRALRVGKKWIIPLTEIDKWLEQ